MSNPNVSKAGAETRKAGGSPTRPTNKSGNIPNPPRNTAQSKAASASRLSASNRPRAQVVTRKKGFRLKPLDIGLILAGVLIVGIIVFSAFQAPATQINHDASVPQDAQSVAVGAAAPAFTVQDVDGGSHSLSDYKGKVVVAEFMATWCPHCQKETPVYNMVYDNYVATNKGVEMIGINATERGHDGTSPATIEDLKWFKTNWGSKYPLFFDAALASAQAYGIKSFPSVYIIDKQGNVAMQPSTDSQPTYAQISTKIDELLAK
jgi:peroxiredoxin